MATYTIPESAEDIKKANQAISRLETMKADLYDVIEDDELYNCFDTSINRIKSITQEAKGKILAQGGIAEAEGVNEFIERLHKEGKSRDAIVERVLLEYRTEDAEDLVDTWFEYNEEKCCGNGGFFSLLNKKVNVAKFFQGGKTKGSSAPTLFAAAKASKTTAKKETGSAHQIVELSEKQFPGITDKLKRFLELKNEIADLEGDLKMIDGEVREIAREQFVKLYATQRRNPNTFLITGELGGCIMVVPTDRYLSIDADRASQLEATIRPDAVEEKTTYIFNNDMLQKYETVLSELIKNSSKIDQDDKDKLIEAKVVYTVKKGSIDRLYEWFGDKLDNAFRAIQPVFQLKKCSK